MSFFVFLCERCAVGVRYAVGLVPPLYMAIVHVACADSACCKISLISKNKLKYRERRCKNALLLNFIITFAAAKTGKSCTASSLRIPQDGNVAKVVGCSGAIQVACPPASLAQLARARDL